MSHVTELSGFGLPEFQECGVRGFMGGGGL